MFRYLKQDLSIYQLKRRSTYTIHTQRIAFTITLYYTFFYIHTLYMCTFVHNSRVYKKVFLIIFSRENQFPVGCWQPSLFVLFSIVYFVFIIDFICVCSWFTEGSLSLILSGRQQRRTRGGTLGGAVVR